MSVFNPNGTENWLKIALLLKALQDSEEDKEEEKDEDSD